MDSIEGRIKKIASSLQDQKDSSEIDSVIMKEKEEMLAKLFDMYPYLQKEKNNIISECLKNKKKGNMISISNCHKDTEEIVLEQITVDESVYYKDNEGGVFTDKYELVGIFKGINNAGQPDCEFFNKKYSDYNDHKIDELGLK